VLAYPPPQAAPSRARTSSDGFDFVGELYLEDDSWQLRPEFHKKRRLKSVIVFKTSVPSRPGSPWNPHATIRLAAGASSHCLPHDLLILAPGGHYAAMDLF
jgi:hypothetical protein